MMWSGAVLFLAFDAVVIGVLILFLLSLAKSVRAVWRADGKSLEELASAVSESTKFKA